MKTMDRNPKAKKKVEYEEQKHQNMFDRNLSYTKKKLKAKFVIRNDLAEYYINFT